MKGKTQLEIIRGLIDLNFEFHHGNGLASLDDDHRIFHGFHSFGQLRHSMPIVKLGNDVNG